MSSNLGRGIGGRGLYFEELINMTNEYYFKNNIAVIQKIATPITPVKMEGNQIILAYFNEKSTVDYIGVAQNISICFDAKQTNRTSLPLANIHKHQLEFMQKFDKQGGIAFILVYFKQYEEVILMPIEDLLKFAERSKTGQKSISYKEFDDKYKMKIKGAKINYLEAVNVYLESRSSIDNFD